MEGLDLTLQSILLLSNQLSVTAERGEFFGEVKGDSRGSAGSIAQNQRRTRPSLWAQSPLFPGHSAGLISCERKRPGRVRAELCLIVKDSSTLELGGHCRANMEA